MAGNLRIITNNMLRKLFSKGPKYGENRTTDYGKAKESIITGSKKRSVLFETSWKVFLISLF